MYCVKCKSENIISHGVNEDGFTQLECKNCELKFAIREVGIREQVERAITRVFERAFDMPRTCDESMIHDAIQEHTNRMMKIFTRSLHGDTTE